VQAGEMFYIKIQGNTEIMHLLIYDYTRECQFRYMPGLRGFNEMLAKVQADPSADGRKTYMAASFNTSGDCVVYPGQTTVQNW
jgi:hypothetical protein